MPADPLSALWALLRHLDNLVPLVLAVAGVIGWIVKKSREARGAASAASGPAYDLAAATDDATADPPVVAPIAVPRPKRVHARAVAPPPVPAEERPGAPLPESNGVFVRRLGQRGTIRDAFIAAEIFGPPPGLR